MKKFAFIILLLSLSALTYFYQELEKDSGAKRTERIASREKSDNANLASTNAKYLIKTKFDLKSKLLRTNQIVYWINNSDKNTEEIQFHLYANAYKNNKTELGKVIDLTEESSTEFKFNSILVDGEPASVTYSQPDIVNAHDLTAAKIQLKKSASAGDTVKIEFNFDLKIPLSTSGFGYASGSEFYFISRWYPQIAVFKEGKWICNQLHPFSQEFNAVADYEISIEMPRGLEVLTNGQLLEKTATGSNIVLKYSQNNISEFIWIASEKFITETKNISLQSGSKIRLNLFSQPGHEDKCERIFDIAEKALSYLEKNIGRYPYSQINLVDLPRTFKNNFNSYPGIISFKTPLFSPAKSNIIEKEIISEITKQYFSAIIKSNPVYESWLSSGMAEYFSVKILREVYGESQLYFKLINYYPIFGILFNAYKEIPIIYSLTSVMLPEAADSYRYYYANPTISISDTTFKLPGYDSYAVNAIHKPVLMFLSLEKILGKNKLFEIVSKYYSTFRLDYPEGSQFWEILNGNTSADLNWFVDNIYTGSKIFDYRIKNLTHKNTNEYEVYVERYGEGTFKTEVALCTDRDTLIQKWDGKESWKIFKFKTNNLVIAAEIDPYHKNIFDINFPNNSYSMKPHYWASMTLAVRWFFWIQSALMLLGSIG